MNALLPILTSSQNGANAISQSGAIKAPVGQVLHDQSQLSSQTFPQAFSQVLRDQETTSVLLNQLQAFVSTDNRHGATSQPSLTQKDFRSLEMFVGHDVNKKVLGESPAYRIPTPLEASVLPILDSDALADPASLVSTNVIGASVATNESISDQGQKLSFEHAPLPLAFPTIALTPLKGTHALANEVLPSGAFQSIGGEPTLGQVRHDLDMKGNFPGRGHVSLPNVLESGTVSQQSAVPNVLESGTVSQQSAVPNVLESGTVSQQGVLAKVPEAGLVSQPVPQGSGEKHASLVLKQEDVSLTRPIAQPVKDVASHVQHVGRLVQEAETLRTPIVQASLNPLPRSQQAPLNPTAPVTAIPAEGPTGFTGSGQTNQASLKSIQGDTSVSNTLTGQAHEHRTVVPADLPGDTGLPGKGERIQTMGETSIKSMGLEPNNGQSLGGGMNHSSNSQSGFQQPASSPGQGPGQGVGLRGLEERGLELPPPALQRLQMDVQLSEGQRVQIDVGVQNRQVYAGLVMDHSVLRNLAAQFVPQLQNQLTEVDLELQEFSAEVREERNEHADTLFHDRQSHDPRESRGSSYGERRSALTDVHRPEERGLHLVA